MLLCGNLALVSIRLSFAGEWRGFGFSGGGGLFGQSHQHILMNFIAGFGFGSWFQGGSTFVGLYYAYTY